MEVAMKDHKNMYGIYLRSSMVVSLILVVGAFLFVPTISVTPYSGRIDAGDRVIDVFPPIDNPDRPTPPRPNRPNPVINDGGGDADSVMVTIVPTDFNYIPSPQDYNIIEIVPYYKVEVKPQPVSIPKPQYPELARKAGIEGTVVVKALVDVNGSIAEVKILKSSGNQMLDQAALIAAKHATFSPARMRDRFVQVWVSIPIRFTLTW
jgi:protein TonB